MKRSLLSPRAVLRALKGMFDHVRLKLSKAAPPRRRQPVGRRTTSFTGETRGRPVRARRPKCTPTGNIALLPSVLSALTATLARGGPRLPLRLGPGDLRTWIRQGKAPLSIVLIADVSASSAWFMKPAEQILSILYRDAYRSRDSMGLVAIQDGAVRVCHHPTRNLRTVLGTMTCLEPSGATPLAEALERGLEVLVRQRRRQPESNPMAILMSDGHPEPLSERPPNLLDAPEYRRAIQVASQYRRARVPLLVVNPGHDVFQDGTLWWGARLGMRIASVAGGRYHGVPTRRALAALPRAEAKRVDLDAQGREIRRLLQALGGDAVGVTPWREPG